MVKSKQFLGYEVQLKKRIQQLIAEKCGGRQQAFVNKTGINKGSVSQYLNGNNIPSVGNIHKIATAFNVTESWLMGFDEDKEDLSVNSTNCNTSRSEQIDLLKNKIIRLIIDEYPKPIQAFSVPMLLNEVEAYFNTLPLELPSD